MVEEAESEKIDIEIKKDFEKATKRERETSSIIKSIENKSEKMSS